MLAFTLVSVILASMFVCNVANKINHQIREGDIALDLMKPVNLLMCYLAEDIGSSVSSLVNKALPMFIVVAVLFRIPLPASPEAAILFLVSAMFSYAILWLMSAIIGLIAFWVTELGPLEVIKDAIIRIEDETFRTNLSTMADVLGIDKFIDTPVRQLSLGQRMKGDLTAAVLHSPSILFLDEPTIGLDVESKHAVRDFIHEINRKRRTTVVLTTHDLDDVEQLCRRLIVVSGGKLVEDGPLQTIIGRLAPFRVLELQLERVAEDVQHSKAEILHQDGLRVSYRFDRNFVTAAELIADLSWRLPIQDLKVKEPDIEDAIRELYRASVVK